MPLSVSRRAVYVVLILAILVPWLLWLSRDSGGARRKPADRETRDSVDSVNRDPIVRRRGDANSKRIIERRDDAERGVDGKVHFLTAIKSSTLSEPVSGVIVYRVVKPARQFIESADVVLGTTNGHGEFEIDAKTIGAFAAEGTTQIGFHRRGFVPEFVSVADISVGARITVFLEKGRQFRAKFVDVHHSPISGVSCLISGASMNLRSTWRSADKVLPGPDSRTRIIQSSSDGGGVAIFDGLTADAYVLAFSHPRFVCVDRSEFGHEFKVEVGDAEKTFTMAEIVACGVEFGESAPIYVSTSTASGDHNKLIIGAAPQIWIKKRELEERFPRATICVGVVGESSVRPIATIAYVQGDGSFKEISRPMMPVSDLLSIEKVDVGGRIESKFGRVAIDIAEESRVGRVSLDLYLRTSNPAARRMGFTCHVPGETTLLPGDYDVFHSSAIHAGMIEPLRIQVGAGESRSILVKFKEKMRQCRIVAGQSVDAIPESMALEFDFSKFGVRTLRWLPGSATDIALPVASPFDVSVRAPGFASNRLRVVIDSGAPDGGELPLISVPVLACEKE